MNGYQAQLPRTPLTDSDDFALHQAAEPFSRVGSLHPRWTERWYFNLQRADGSLIGVCGGGFYPQTGTLEVYACVLANGTQLSLRQRVTEFDRTVLDAADHVAFRIRAPMRSWTMKADGARFSFDLVYDATQGPYLFPPFFVAADLPHQASPLEVDTIQHFVQPGEVTGRLRIDGEASDVAARSFRDRTWGVRTARPRLHQWYVLHLDDGSCVNLIHQERADGTVMVSHLARAASDGAVETAVVDTHDLTFEKASRLLRRGVFHGHTAAGGSVAIEVDNIGDGVRLLGAGYTTDQGAAERLGQVQEEQWDLADQALVARLGRGTIDSPVTARCQWAGLPLRGTGVTETAVARNHWRYGAQIA